MIPHGLVHAFQIIREVSRTNSCSISESLHFISFLTGYPQLYALPMVAKVNRKSQIICTEYIGYLNYMIDSVYIVLGTRLNHTIFTSTNV